MKRIFLISILLIIISLSAVSAAENTTEKNPVEDINVLYDDAYGEVLIKKDNTYDLYITHVPEKCEQDQFKVYIDNKSVKYNIIEYDKDFNQIYGQYTYKLNQSTHNLKVEFIGNDNYSPITKTYDFNATKTIIHIPDTVTQGISYERSVEVYLAEGVEGDLKIKADGKDFTSRYISERKNLFPLDALSFGTHNIEVTFKDSLKAKKKIEVTYYFKMEFYGDEYIHFTLPWDITKTPEIYIDGEKYEYSPEGITYTKIGTHYVKATYPGDEKYPKKTITDTFTIKGEDKIVSNKQTIYMYYKDSKKAYFTVYGPDEITVTLDSFKTTVNVKNHTAAYNVPTLKPGKYTITANSNLLYAKTTLVVKHLITLTKVKVKKSAKKLTLKATLKNTKPIKNKKVTFIFKGKKYIKKTDSKGIAKVTIPKSVLSKLKVNSKVTYKAIYGKDQVKYTVKVLK